jgi:hypothetical protein
MDQLADELAKERAYRCVEDQRESTSTDLKQDREELLAAEKDEAFEKARAQEAAQYAVGQELEPVEGVLLGEARPDQFTGLQPTLWFRPGVAFFSFYLGAVGVASTRNFTGARRLVTVGVCVGAGYLIGAGLHAFAGAMLRWVWPKRWVRGLEAKPIAGVPCVALSTAERTAGDPKVEARPSVVRAVRMRELVQWYRLAWDLLRPWKECEKVYTTVHTTERNALVHLGILSTLRRAYDYTRSDDQVRHSLTVRAANLASLYVIPSEYSDCVMDTRDFAYLEYLHRKRVQPVVPLLGCPAGAAF